MSATAEKIMDVMLDLIQTRGFNAVSYQDIADRLKIRKASIHYHFPTKFSLGKAVIERYRLRLLTAVEEAEKKRGPRRYEDLLDFYFTPYIQFSTAPDTVCLCGSLTGEFPTLPRDMKDQVVKFFKEHQAWLETLLIRGRDAGEFHFSGSPKIMARLIFNSLQGALLVKRSTGDVSQLHDVLKVLKSSLKTPSRR